ncbi:MAG: VanZ family protein [Deltaproteobacteria bacterium]|nr:VanZ family protein [Deltaproteobacteria bacterium]
MPYLHLGIQSRADFVANILLFIPLSFFLMGSWLIQNKPSYKKKFTVALFVLIFCCLLSFMVEFLQQFFPPRTVSQNDILAETSGAIIGIILWIWHGPNLTIWAQGVISGHRPHSLAVKAIIGYIIALIFFSVFPLDLTISPVEIYHKWKEGRFILIPFNGDYGSFNKFIYGILTDIILFIPIGFLSGKTLKNPFKKSLISRGFLVGVTVAAAIEFLQIFVYSRFSDVTDIITGGLGGLAGGILCCFITEVNADYNLPEAKKKSFVRPNVLLITGYFCILIIIHWSPFNFSTDRTLILSSYKNISIIPFYNYYYSSEFHAMTEVLRKFLFFMPLGILIERFWKDIDCKAYIFINLIVLGLFAGILEAGQIFLPGHYPDITDILLRIFGGLSGIWIYRRMDQVSDGTD